MTYLDGDPTAVAMIWIGPMAIAPPGIRGIGFPGFHPCPARPRGRGARQSLTSPRRPASAVGAPRCCGPAATHRPEPEPEAGEWARKKITGGGGSPAGEVNLPQGRDTVGFPSWPPLCHHHQRQRQPARGSSAIFTPPTSFSFTASTARHKARDTTSVHGIG